MVVSSNNVDDISNNISTSSNGTIINRIEEFRHILRVRDITKNKSNIAISNRQNQQYHLVLAELKKKFENKQQSRLLLRVDITEDGDDSEEISENKKKCTSCELNIDVTSTQTSNNNNNQTGTIDICFPTMDSKKQCRPPNRMFLYSAVDGLAISIINKCV